MSDGWIGFLGGILATLVGALIANMLQRSHDAKRRKEQAQLEAYFLLIDLHNWYFFIASAEVTRKDPDPEILETCRRISLQLNDKLRAFDNVEHLEETLTVLFDESIPSANERANRLSGLIEQYAKLVNPKYASVMSRISRGNLLRHGPGATPSINAPGSWRYIK